MFWNTNMGISYIDYKLAAMQAAGWRITRGTEIESVGAVTYIATKTEQRVVMSFNEKDQLIKVTGSNNQKMGVATYTRPFNEDAIDRFIKYFKAI